MITQKISADQLKKMASILIDATVEDSGLAAIGSLEDAEHVVILMLDVVTSEQDQNILRY